MAKARALDRRRKSIRSIRKITRTMELIATAKFRKAMERAMSATAYTRRITALVAKLLQSGQQIAHPLLDKRPKVNNAVLLVLTANRGLCGGYNSSVLRIASAQYKTLKSELPSLDLEVAGKRGISAFKFRKYEIGQAYTHFDDKLPFAQVEELANRYLSMYQSGQIDRLDIAYTKFESLSRQHAVVETLLPMGEIEATTDGRSKDSQSNAASKNLQYDFLPSAASIVDEIVPTSFKVRLFKCFLDAAVSEQIARRAAMKSATENAGEMIANLSIEFNRARQSQITGELLEIIGGSEALNK